MIAMTVNTMQVKYFDTLEYVKRSKKIEDRGELAEYQVKQIETAIETAVQCLREEQKDFIRKSDTQHFATEEVLHFEKETLAMNIKGIENLLRETKEELTVEIQDVCNEIRDVRVELKAEIQDVRNEIRDVRVELKAEIQDVRKELKGDICRLDRDIQTLRYDTLKFVVWTGVAVVVCLGGLLGHGFHWF